MTKSQIVDVLAVGAHPDDADINVGGTLLALKALGRKTAVVDLTRGELASRGSAEIRREEAAQAGSILGLEFRESLGLVDGDVAVDADSRLALIQIIRRCRPRLVLTHSRFGHPDHAKAAQLTEEAVHHSGLASVETGQQRHRPGKIAYWISFDQPLTPHFVVDVTPFYQRKEDAIRAYRSQLGQGGGDEPETYLSRPDFLEQLCSFHYHLGSQAGCRFGEGFLLSRIPRIEDPTQC